MDPELYPSSSEGSKQVDHDVKNSYDVEIELSETAVSVCLEGDHLVCILHFYLTMPLRCGLLFFAIKPFHFHGCQLSVFVA